MNLAFLVGGPRAGELIELPGPWLELEALKPRLYPIAVIDAMSTDDICRIPLETVRYKPAVLGGFLWYVQ